VLGDEDDEVSTEPEVEVDTASVLLDVEDDEADAVLGVEAEVDTATVLLVVAPLAEGASSSLLTNGPIVTPRRNSTDSTLPHVGHRAHRRYARTARALSRSIEARR
jgi:hypothetical protein